MAFKEIFFHGNTFPPKDFQINAFHKMISTKCRKSTMWKNKGSLGYSSFLWGVLHGNSYLISQRTSWQKIQVFKYLLSPYNHSRVAFVLPSLNPVKELLHSTGQKWGAALKVILSIFDNTYMYHLCVQEISVRTREESALGTLEPLDRVIWGYFIKKVSYIISKLS